MKHTTKQGIKAKKNLITYHKFKEIDFFEIDNIIYMNCKDNVGEQAYDVYNEITSTQKEEYEEYR
jgi:hypothetical protein